MDKLQKVLNEVERLQNELITEKKKGNGSDIDDACILELQNIKSYIKFVQEEPESSVWHDANTLPTNYEIKDILVVYNQYGREYVHLYWEDGVYSDAQGLNEYNWTYVEKWAYIEDLLKFKEK